MIARGQEDRAVTFSPLSVGKVLALVVLVLAIVFLAVGRLSLIVGGELALIALAVVLL